MKDLVSEYVMAFVEVIAGLGLIFAMTKLTEALVSIVG